MWKENDLAYLLLILLWAFVFFAILFQLKGLLF